MTAQIIQILPKIHQKGKMIPAWWALLFLISKDDCNIWGKLPLNLFFLLLLISAQKGHQQLHRNTIAIQLKLESLSWLGGNLQRPVDRHSLAPLSSFCNYIKANGMLHEPLHILWSVCILKLKHSQCWDDSYILGVFTGQVLLLDSNYTKYVWSTLMYGWNSFFSFIH